MDETETATPRRAAPGAQLRLEPGRWYGMTMWPGYGDRPYHSPIRIDAFEDLGGELSVEFLNAAYAQGVRDFTERLVPLAHQPDYLIARIADQPERTVAIVDISQYWLETYFPRLVEEVNSLSRSGGLAPDIVLELFSQGWERA